MKAKSLALMVGVLLLHLLLRAHQITRLPVFIDEDNHIRRAAIAYDLEQHPAQNSHGKVLLYMVLGIFDLTERGTALHLARTMVALVSLLTCAGVFVIGKKLFHPAAGVFAALIYALIPFALFYERMAFADPLAGALGVLTLWQSIRLAEKPTWGRGAWVGVMAALTVAAKLTMAFAVGFPVAAVLLSGRYTTFLDMLRRYLPALIVSGVVFTLLWLTIIIPAQLSYLTDAPDFIIVNTELADPQASTASVADKLIDAADKLITMSAAPLVILLILLGGIALWHRPAATGLIGVAWLLAWLPGVLFVENLQTRYLMSGVPMLALLMGAGYATITDRRATRESPLPQGMGILLWGVILIWAVGFAIPFAGQAAQRPTALHLPPLDQQNYLWDKFNAYGTRAALRDLDAQADQPVAVLLLVIGCRQYDLYEFSQVEPLCPIEDETVQYAGFDWQPEIARRLANGETIYAITDFTSVRDDQFTWERVAAYSKPFGYQQVILWRIR